MAEALAFSRCNEYYTYEKPPQRKTISVRLQRKVSDCDQVSSVSLATSLCKYCLASSWVVAGFHLTLGIWLFLSFGGITP